MVTTTGMISPSSLLVFALKFLQKSMMFTPCGPRAVPTGGAGVAFPAAIWSFTIACTFFAIVFSWRSPASPARLAHFAARPLRRPLRCVRVLALSGRAKALRYGCRSAALQGCLQFLDLQRDQF